jgi:hypothetical protein
MMAFVLGEEKNPKPEPRSTRHRIIYFKEV